jgi:hypothetical protein
MSDAEELTNTRLLALEKKVLALEENLPDDCKMSRLVMDW